MQLQYWNGLTALLTSLWIQICTMEDILRKLENELELDPDDEQEEPEEYMEGD